MYVERLDRTKETILEILNDREAVPRKELVGLISGIPERAVRKCIEELRDEGSPIGSSPKRGYFLIRTEEDWDEAVREFGARAKACFRHYIQLKKWGENEFSRQITLDDMMPAEQHVYTGRI